MKENSMGKRPGSLPRPVAEHAAKQHVPETGGGGTPPHIKPIESRENHLSAAKAKSALMYPESSSIDPAQKICIVVSHPNRTKRG
jgi:hypothetical protein